jgi:hypothetical protein
MKENEEELLGMPTSEVPTIEAGSKCNGKKWEKRGEETVFVGYCENPAGKGTDHLAEGRCKHHGGSSLKGEEHPNFEHGLFSDFLDEDDRRDLEIIGERGNLANLQSLINYEVFRLRRAVKKMSEDAEGGRGSFWDAFDRILNEATETGGLDSGDIAAMADLFGSSNKAFQSRVEEVRKLVKTYEELTEGRKVNIDGDMAHTHAGEPGGSPIRIEWKESEAENEEEGQEP